MVSKLRQELGKYRDLARMKLRELKDKLADPTVPDDEKAKIQKILDNARSTCSVKLNGKEKEDKGND